MECGDEAALDQVGSDQRRDAGAGNVGEEVARVHAGSLQDLDGNLQHGGEVT